MSLTFKLRIPNRQDATFGIVNAYTLTDVPTPVGFNPFESIKCLIKIYLHLRME